MFSGDQFPTGYTMGASGSCWKEEAEPHNGIPNETLGTRKPRSMGGAIAFWGGAIALIHLTP